MEVKIFQFNPFQENTYILIDKSSECVIIDPGCNSTDEYNKLDEFIRSNELSPKYLLNTHAHIDHILGNKFINERYNLKPHFHIDDLFLYQNSIEIARMYGLKYSFLDAPYHYLQDNQELFFGNSVLKCLHVPGHSPGSICFYSDKDSVLISGDVLFRESIGRTDLPGGNHQELLANISERILTLPDNTVVYPGHMSSTTIGYEKMHNPFF